MIETKAAAASHDILCCWVVGPILIGPAAMRCAGNLVTLGRDRSVAGQPPGHFPGVRGSVCGGFRGSVREVFRACQGDEKLGLDEEGMQRILEGGDGTVGVWEGGLQMGEDVCGCAVRAVCRQFGGQLGRRAACGECRADFTLAKAEAFPDALQGAVTEVAVGSADRGEEAAGGGNLESARTRPMRMIASRKSISSRRAPHFPAKFVRGI